MKHSILAVTPLKEEYDELCSGLTSFGLDRKRDRIGKLDACHFPEIQTTISRGGHGKAQFGVQTQYLLNQMKFDLVLCAGAAGALSPDVQVGDLIVATSTFEHDYELKFVKRPYPQFAGDAKSIEQLRKLNMKDQEFSMHFGIVASGDEDVIDIARGRELQEKTNALAVAWEGAGGARACAFSYTPYLEVRGATDIANHKAPVAFDKNLAVAMKNLSLLLATWLQ